MSHHKKISFLFIYSNENSDSEKEKKEKLLINEWKTLFGGGVSDIVMGINTRKSSLKVHYTSTAPHISLLSAFFPLCNENGNNFLCAQEKLLALHKKS